jgi:acetyltransferase-like isoleucine patch superfamily enzyme
VVLSIPFRGTDRMARLPVVASSQGPPAADFLAAYLRKPDRRSHARTRWPSPRSIGGWFACAQPTHTTTNASRAWRRRFCRSRSGKTDPVIEALEPLGAVEFVEVMVPQGGLQFALTFSGLGNAQVRELLRIDTALHTTQHPRARMREPLPVLCRAKPAEWRRRIRWLCSQGRVQMDRTDPGGPMYWREYRHALRESFEFRPSLLRSLRTVVGGTRMLVGRGVRIDGLSRISCGSETVRVGTAFYGFVSPADKTLLRVRGRLRFEGAVAIASGNRWDVGPGALVTVGKGSYFSPNGRLVADQSIQIGRDCALGWDVHLTDSDWHTAIRPDGSRSQATGPIIVGNHVWLGSRVTVLRGAVIPDGCIVAAGSVVREAFSEAGSLIAGVPARVIGAVAGWE